LVVSMLLLVSLDIMRMMRSLARYHISQNYVYIPKFGS
jgi:hypothetical protein